MNKLQWYEWNMQEYLHLISCQFLGWPRSRNRWLYPDVFGWDVDANGDNYIPGLIAFYPNPEHFISQRDRYHFELHLGHCIPGPWDINWRMSNQGFVWADRKPITVMYQSGEREGGWHRFNPDELSRYAGNGERPT